MPQPGTDEVLVAKFAVLLPQLDERQRRLLLGAEAIALGRGGIAVVATAAGVARPTVTRGVAEVKAGGDNAEVPDRVRKPGGGRKSLTVTDPGIVAALDALVDPVHPRGADLASAMDDEVDPEPGRGVDRGRSSGQSRPGR